MHKKVFDFSFIVSVQRGCRLVARYMLYEYVKPTLMVFHTLPLKCNHPRAVVLSAVLNINENRSQDLLFFVPSEVCLSGTQWGGIQNV